MKGVFGKVGWLLILILWFNGAVSAQNEEADPLVTQVRIIPEFGIPIGDSSELFRSPVGGDLFVQHRLSELTFLTVGANAGYMHMPLIDLSDNVSLYSLGAQGGMDFEVMNRVVLEAFIWGGLYYGQLVTDGTAQIGPFLHEGVAINYDISPSVRLGLGGAYRNFFDLSSDFGIFLNFVYRFDYQLNDPLEVKDENFEPLYRELVPRYNQGRSMGTVVLGNTADIEITALTAQMSGPALDLQPELSLIPEGIDPSGEVTLHFTGLIDEDRLRTEELTVKVDISYRYKGWPLVRNLEVPLSVREVDFSENPLSYSLFVARQDRTIQSLAGFTDNTTRYKVIDNIDRGLQLALANYLFLQNLGLNIESEQEFLAGSELPRFPVETLESRDLTVTEAVLFYNSLLEAQGVETAFFRTDNRLCSAVKLDVELHRLDQTYSKKEQLYIQDDQVWLLIDLSDPQTSFVEALNTAAVYQEDDSGELFPLLFGRVEYGETGYSNPEVPLDKGEEETFSGQFMDEMHSVVDWIVRELEQHFLAQLASNPRNVTLLNNLGVLLASNGRLEDAEEYFNKALLSADDKALYVNLGNIAYLNRQLESAAVFFEKATRIDPFNPVVLLGQARVNYELENYGVTVDSFNKLELIDEELAADFSYLLDKEPDRALLEEIEVLRRKVFWLEK